MKKLHEIYRLNKQKGDVGYEIEVEGGNLPWPEGDINWRREEDGSLQPKPDCGEYVLNKPQSLEDFNKDLNDLKKLFEDSGAYIEYSIRAGVHCHVNCQHMTPVQVVNFAVAYYVLENLLVEYCGEDRVGNLFCLRAKDADFVVDRLVEAVVERDLQPLENEDIRYASMNFNSLHKYGSVEFRAMSTTDNWDKLSSWARILIRIRDESLLYENAQDMVGDFSVNGITAFLNRFLGEDKDTVLEGVADVEAKIWEGLRVAQEVAFLAVPKEVVVNLNPFLQQDVKVDF